MCGAESSTLRKDQKYLKSFDMCCWRRLAISWTDRVKNEKVLQIVKDETDMQHTLKIERANWIGHILRMNCPLKHIIEGKIEERREVTEIREMRCKQLLFDEGYEKRRYWKLKDEALDLTLRRTRFGRGNGPVATASW